MKRRGWLFWFAVFTVCLLTVTAGFFYVLVRSFGAAAPSVRDGSSVTVDLAAPYPEEHLYDLGGPFLGTGALTFRDLLIAIGRARDDARVERLVLRVRGSALGWAHVAELRSRLAEFKESGKPIVAFVEYAGTRDYVIASVADEIYMHPRGFLDLRGVRAELTYLRSTLDMLGVEAEFERIGAYKDGPDVFLRTSMSPETREAIGALVETIHETIVGAVAEGRGKSLAEAEALLARGPFTADAALAAGLVDDHRHLDEIRKKSAATTPGEKEDEDQEEDEHEESPEVSLQSYRFASQRGPGFGTAGRVALIYGIGTIVTGRNTDDALFGRVMGSDTLAEAFKEAREDDSIDAVVFRIDSPGGSDIASDIIWREAALTREKKPVIVSMGDLAASGGYWVATASDVIVAEPTTITGSIGIYAGKFNLSGLYEKIGVSKDGVSTTQNADFFSDSRGFSEEERERLRAILRSGYEAFLERVAASRGMTTEEVDRIARGRVWSGEDALELGLVDELGGLYRALEIAKERLGLEPDDLVELRILPRKESLFEALLSNFASGVRGGVPVLSRLGFRPDAVLDRSPVLRLLGDGRPLALTPYTIEVK